MKLISLNSSCFVHTASTVANNKLRSDIHRDWHFWLWREIMGIWKVTPRLFFHNSMSNAEARAIAQTQTQQKIMLNHMLVPLHCLFISSSSAFVYRRLHFYLSPLDSKSNDACFVLLPASFVRGLRSDPCNSQQCHMSRVFPWTSSHCEHLIKRETFSVSKCFCFS